MTWQQGRLFGFVLYLFVALGPTAAHVQGPLTTGIYAIRTADGHFMGALDGGNHTQNAFFTTQTYAGPWERYRLFVEGNGTVVIQTYSGHLVSALDGGNHTQNALFTTQTYPGPWEKFHLIDLGDGTFAIRSLDGHFLGALDGGNHSGADALFTTQTYAGPWERFRLVPLPNTEFAAPPDTWPMDAIWQKVRERGGGIPAADTPAPLPLSGNRGYYQNFENGFSVYWSPQTGAHVVLGAIRDRWLNLGGAQSVLGLPVTDEATTPDTIGRYNHFEGGSIYWTPCDGAWNVYGAIRDYWAAHGWETGHLGYPISNEEDEVDAAGLPTGNRTSRFQYGVVKWNSVQGAWEENEVNLKVLTYNVQFRSKVADTFDPQWPNTKARAETIGHAIGYYDIIALQEVFLSDRRKQIIEAAEVAAAQCGKPSRLPSGRYFDVATGPDYVSDTIDVPVIREAEVIVKGGINAVEALARKLFGGKNRSEPVDDSGLLLLSRFPIIHVGQYTYDAKSGIDAWARKGVLHVVVWRGGANPAEDFIDVYITHQQAGDSNIRDGQRVELANLIAQTRLSAPNAPAMVMGDFNTNGNPDQWSDSNTEYSKLNSLLHSAVPTLTDLWPLHHGTQLGGTNRYRGGRIDYIFLTQGLGVRSQSVSVNEFPDSVHGKEGFLSDHAGVEARMIWEYRPRPVFERTSSLIADVRVTRLRALSTDSCNKQMDFYGDVQIVPGTTFADSNHRVTEGNDVTPVGLGQSAAITGDIQVVDATITIRDNDDAFCGGGDDDVDVNPLEDQTSLRIRINIPQQTVELLNSDGSPERLLGTFGVPLRLFGTNGKERAEITFVVLVQPGTYVGTIEL